MDPTSFLIVLFISLAIEVVAYLIMPKPKAPKPPAVSDEQAPTADASRPIPWIFGELTIDGTNVLFFGDKAVDTYMVDA